jgi:ubiquinone biosynthesis protein
VLRITDELRWFFVESPRDWRQISTKLKRGELQLVLQHRGLERLIRELDSFSNRLSVSMLIAALIVGSSLIMTIDKGYMIFDVPILGLMGYSFAAILGILLVVSILRSGKF